MVTFPTAQLYTKHIRGTSHLHLTVAQLWKSREPLVASNTHGSVADTVYLRVVVTFLTAQLHTDAHSSHKAQQRNISPPSYCCTIMEIQLTPCSWPYPWVLNGPWCIWGLWSHFRQHKCTQIPTAHTKHNRARSHLHLTVTWLWRSWEALVASNTHGSLSDTV